MDDNEDLVAFMKDSLSFVFPYTVSFQWSGSLAENIGTDAGYYCQRRNDAEMDGNELCRWVKTDKRTSDIPMILLTARQAVEDKVEGLTIGADDYVTKPFNVEILYSAYAQVD